MDGGIYRVAEIQQPAERQPSCRQPTECQPQTWLQLAIRDRQRATALRARLWHTLDKRNQQQEVDSRDERKPCPIQRHNKPGDARPAQVKESEQQAHKWSDGPEHFKRYHDESVSSTRPFHEIAQDDEAVQRCIHHWRIPH